jgi:hypothetical protein
MISRRISKQPIHALVYFAERTIHREPSGTLQCRGIRPTAYQRWPQTPQVMWIQGVRARGSRLALYLLEDRRLVLKTKNQITYETLPSKCNKEKWSRHRLADEDN